MIIRKSQCRNPWQQQQHQQCSLGTPPQFYFPVLVPFSPTVANAPSHATNPTSCDCYQLRPVNHHQVANAVSSLPTSYHPLHEAQGRQQRHNHIEVDPRAQLRSSTFAFQQFLSMQEQINAHLGMPPPLIHYELLQSLAALPPTTSALTTPRSHPPQIGQQLATTASSAAPPRLVADSSSTSRGIYQVCIAGHLSRLFLLIIAKLSINNGDVDN